MSPSTLWTDNTGYGFVHERNHRGEKLRSMPGLQGRITIESCDCPLAAKHTHVYCAICPTCGYYSLVDATATFPVIAHSARGALLRVPDETACPGSGAVVAVVLQLRG